jgi:hypothetical protein
VNTKEKLAIKLAPRLSELVGHEIDPSRIKFYPARGYWTHTHQDVMGFTGSYRFSDNSSALFSIGSWDNMTDCIRYGFLLHDERKSYHPEAHFMIEALKRRRPRISMP